MREGVTHGPRPPPSACTTFSALFIHFHPLFSSSPLFLRFLSSLLVLPLSSNPPSLFLSPPSVFPHPLPFPCQPSSTPASILPAQRPPLGMAAGVCGPPAEESPPVCYCVWMLTSRTWKDIRTLLRLITTCTEVLRHTRSSKVPLLPWPKLYPALCL